MASLKDLPILIVDDNEATRKAIGKVFEKIGFANITAVGDIISAWHVLAKRGGGIVLCDALVDGKYGIHLLKKVRATPQLAKIPFLVMSTKKERSIIEAHTKAGASEFIAKPFDSAILLTKLKKALAAPPKAPPAESQEAKLLAMAKKSMEGYDTQKAIAYYTKAAQANSMCAEAYRGLAEAFKQRKDTEQYMVFMNTAAKAYVERGDMAEAEQVFQELRLYDPKTPNPFATAAAVRVEKNELPKAKELLERAVAVEPDNAAHHNALGDVAMRMGDKGTAQEHVTAALKLQDDFPEARKAFKALTGQKWTENEQSQAYQKKKAEQEEEEEKRGTVRFWVPDLLIGIKGRKDHFALVEMSMKSLAFSPMDEEFKIEEQLKFDILKLTDLGTRTEVKGLKGGIVRVDSEAVGVRLRDLTSDQEKEMSEILTAAQERQKEQFREENKEEIKFDIDMLFM